MTKLLPAGMEIIGMTAIAVAAWWMWPPVGVLLAGAFLVFIAQGLRSD